MKSIYYWLWNSRTFLVGMRIRFCSWLWIPRALMYTVWKIFFQIFESLKLMKTNFSSWLWNSWNLHSNVWIRNFYWLLISWALKCAKNIFLYNSWRLFLFLSVVYSWNLDVIQCAIMHFMKSICSFADSIQRTCNLTSAGDYFQCFSQREQKIPDTKWAYSLWWNQFTQIQVLNLSRVLVSTTIYLFQWW